MHYRFLYFLAIVIIFQVSCGTKKVEQTRYLKYKANPSYVGSHPTVGLESNIYIIDKESKMQFSIDMGGINETKTYKLHIHAADTSEPYGYTGNPIIDLGTMFNNLPVTADVTTMPFSEFTQNFKGYYLVHDPDNISNDTTTLLIFGKIGSDW